MFQSRRRTQQEAVADARRACLQKGATIYTHLKSDELDMDEYLTLTAEEFQCLRMFCHEEHDYVVLDCVWKIIEGADVYLVRLDWDISQIKF